MIRAELRDAVAECSSRGLTAAAAFCAELLAGLTASDSAAAGPGAMAPSSLAKPNLAATVHALDVASEHSWPSHEEHDLYLLAKTYFDTQQYTRCAWVLRNSQSPKSMFLWAYAMFHVGEKKRLARLGPVFGISDVGSLLNDEIDGTLSRLGEAPPRDPWILYLRGMLLCSQKSFHEAVELLVQSVHLYPLNWSAWLQLEKCMRSELTFFAVRTRLPDSLMTKLFLVHCALENHFTLDDVHQLLSQLENTFKTSPEIAALRAKLYYEEKSTKLAESKWESLFHADPYRFEDIDIYSGLLFVLERHVQLGFLAQNAVQVDRNRPETCIAVGNLYASRELHETAAVYFRQALSLDRFNSNTWVLLGHEYLELKLTEAATEAYRRAADCNQRNYSAWFGLGNVYSLLELYPIAIENFLKSLVIRPRDAKIWAHLASTYYKMESFTEARHAAERSCMVDPDFVDPNMCALLGKLFESGTFGNEAPRAEHWYRRAWLARDSGAMALHAEPRVNAALFLARQAAARAIEDIALGVLDSTQSAVARFAEYIDAALAGADTERAAQLRVVQRELRNDVVCALTKKRATTRPADEDVEEDANAEPRAIYRRVASAPAANERAQDTARDALVLSSLESPESDFSFLLKMMAA